MALFSNKYRVESSRLKGWDYSNTGLYFITICTFGMKNHFGEIIKGNVILSDAGKIVDEEWLNTAVLRKNAILDEYIVMPNHFHGIIALEKINDDSNGETTHRVVSTKAVTLIPNSLGSIIGQFKSKCTKRIWKYNTGFKWQGKFHDRIIRNDAELNNVREYIRYNPIKWNDDEFYID